MLSDSTNTNADGPPETLTVETIMRSWRTLLAIDITPESPRRIIVTPYIPRPVIGYWLPDVPLSKNRSRRLQKKLALGSKRTFHQSVRE